MPHHQFSEYEVVHCELVVVMCAVDVDHKATFKYWCLIGNQSTLSLTRWPISSGTYTLPHWPPLPSLLVIRLWLSIHCYHAADGDGDDDWDEPRVYQVNRVNLPSPQNTTIQRHLGREVMLSHPTDDLISCSIIGLFHIALLQAHIMCTICLSMQWSYTTSDAFIHFKANDDHSHKCFINTTWHYIDLMQTESQWTIIVCGDVCVNVCMILQYVLLWISLVCVNEQNKPCQ